MEVGMSLNAVVRLPLSNSRTLEDGLVRHSLFSTRSVTQKKQMPEQRQRRTGLAVEAKGKKGMQARQFQRPPPPPLPKIEDYGNPRFVIFIRMANVRFFSLFLDQIPVDLGGTTAKIMLAAKDNFLGKYIYKDTLDKNLSAVIYRDEKEIQKTAFKEFKILRTAMEFRYVENGNLKAALATNDVVELPTQDKLKTVLNKVKDFFRGSKDSLGKMTTLNTSTTEESEEKAKEKEKVKS